MSSSRSQRLLSLLTSAGLEGQGCLGVKVGLDTNDREELG